MALAVAADGRALIAGTGPGAMSVAERAPGQAAFAAVPVSAPGTWVSEPSVALNDAGAAVLAWRDPIGLDGGVHAAWRASPGRFGPVRTLARGHAEGAFGLSEPELYVLGGPADSSPVTLATLVAPDGRAAVAWTQAGRRPASPAAAGAAAGDVTHGLVAQRFPGPVRSAGAVGAWRTAAGDPGLAWSDSEETFGGLLPGGGGRLHVALPGARPAPDPPAPRLTLHVPAHPALYREQALPVTVRCSAACDVRITVGESAETRSLAHAGRLHIGLQRPQSYPGGPGRLHPSRRIRVRAVASAPGGHAERTARATSRVRRRPAPPVPHIRGLRARRTAAGIRARDGAPNALPRGRYVQLFVSPLDRDRLGSPVRVRVR